jgi:hypothetical protein
MKILLTVHVADGASFYAYPATAIGKRKRRANGLMVNHFDNKEFTFGNPGVRPNVDGISEMKVFR